jgi:hypothetical protein
VNEVKNMMDIATVASVVVLFLVRIGIPIIALVSVGVLIDRWQRRREPAPMKSPAETETDTQPADE